MYLCVKQQLKKLTKQQYSDLRELCHIAKNLYNVAVYNVRQYYFIEKFEIALSWL
jgi:putative transposase